MNKVLAILMLLFSFTVTSQSKKDTTHSFSIAINYGITLPLNTYKIPTAEPASSYNITSFIPMSKTDVGVILTLGENKISISTAGYGIPLNGVNYFKNYYVMAGIFGGVYTNKINIYFAFNGGLSLTSQPATTGYTYSNQFSDTTLKSYSLIINPNITMQLLLTKHITLNINAGYFYMNAYFIGDHPATSYYVFSYNPLSLSFFNSTIGIGYKF